MAEANPLKINLIIQHVLRYVLGDEEINIQHFGKLSIHYKTLRLVCKDFHGQLSSSARCLILLPTIDYQKNIWTMNVTRAKTGGILIERKNENNNIKTFMIGPNSFFPHVKTFVCYIFWGSKPPGAERISSHLQGVCAIDTSKLLDVFCDNNGSTFNSSDKFCTHLELYDLPPLTFIGDKFGYSSSSRLFAPRSFFMQTTENQIIINIFQYCTDDSILDIRPILQKSGDALANGRHICEDLLRWSSSFDWEKNCKRVLGDGLWEASLPFPPIDQEDVLKPGTLAEIVILQGHYKGLWVKVFIINVKFIKDDVVNKIKHSYDVYVLRTNKYENAVSWGGNIAKGISRQHLRRCLTDPKRLPKSISTGQICHIQNINNSSYISDNNNLKTLSIIGWELKDGCILKDFNDVRVRHVQGIKRCVIEDASGVILPVVEYNDFLTRVETKMWEELGMAGNDFTTNYMEEANFTPQAEQEEAVVLADLEQDRLTIEQNRLNIEYARQRLERLTRNI